MDAVGLSVALPDNGIDRDPLTAADAHDLYCVGDWVAGEDRVHAALRSRLDVAERVQ